MTLEVLLVPKDHKGDLSFTEVGVLRHLHQHLLDYTEAVTVGCVYYEKYSVHVWVEEAPVFSVPSLPAHVVHDTLLVVEWQGYLLYVYIWCCCIVLVCVFWDSLESLYHCCLSRPVQAHQEKLPVFFVCKTHFLSFIISNN